MLFSYALSAIVLASSALAIPLALPSSGCKCKDNLAKAKFTVPANQTALVAPGTAPTGIVLGVGVQNYTCSSTGTWTSAGAVAELFDISCLVGTPAFDKASDVAYSLWQKAPARITTLAMGDIISQLNHGQPVGQHYFITNSAGGISPKWDHTSSGPTKGQADEFFVGKKVGDIVSPESTSDVDWLMLSNVSGSLADTIFRMETRGGVQPSSCTAGAAPISIKYTAQYWYFGGKGF